MYPILFFLLNRRHHHNVSVTDHYNHYTLQPARSTFLTEEIDKYFHRRNANLIVSDRYNKPLLVLKENGMTNLPGRIEKGREICNGKNKLILLIYL